ncbi:unnamed protein product [Amoebophrya sp. A120]|nr:unnamed protein product [Amoebophrya sp. A120]|eukprot:GSA120T00010005001.1
MTRTTSSFNLSHGSMTNTQLRFHPRKNTFEMNKSKLLSSSMDLENFVVNNSGRVSTNQNNDFCTRHSTYSDLSAFHPILNPDSKVVPPGEIDFVINSSSSCSGTDNENNISSTFLLGGLTLTSSSGFGNYGAGNGNGEDYRDLQLSSSTSLAPKIPSDSFDLEFNDDCSFMGRKLGGMMHNGGNDPSTISMNTSFNHSAGTNASAAQMDQNQYLRNGGFFHPDMSHISFGASGEVSCYSMGGATGGAPGTAGTIGGGQGEEQITNYIEDGEHAVQKPSSPMVPSNNLTGTSVSISTSAQPTAASTPLSCTSSASANNTRITLDQQTTAALLQHLNQAIVAQEQQQQQLGTNQMQQGQPIRFGGQQQGHQQQVHQTGGAVSANIMGGANNNINQNTSDLLLNFSALSSLLQVPAGTTSNLGSCSMNTPNNSSSPLLGCNMNNIGSLGSTTPQASPLRRTENSEAAVPANQTKRILQTISIRKLPAPLFQVEKAKIVHELRQIGQHALSQFGSTNSFELKVAEELSFNLCPRTGERLPAAGWKLEVDLPAAMGTLQPTKITVAKIYYVSRQAAVNSKNEETSKAGAQGRDTTTQFSTRVDPRETVASTADDKGNYGAGGSPTRGQKELLDLLPPAHHKQSADFLIPLQGNNVTTTPRNTADTFQSACSGHAESSPCSSVYGGTRKNTIATSAFTSCRNSPMASMMNNNSSSPAGARDSIACSAIFTGRNSEENKNNQSGAAACTASSNANANNRKEASMEVEFLENNNFLEHDGQMMEMISTVQKVVKEAIVAKVFENENFNANGTTSTSSDAALSTKKMQPVLSVDITNFFHQSQKVTENFKAIFGTTKTNTCFHPGPVNAQLSSKINWNNHDSTQGGGGAGGDHQQSGTNLYCDTAQPADPSFHYGELTFRVCRKCSQQCQKDSVKIQQEFGHLLNNTQQNDSSTSGENNTTSVLCANRLRMQLLMATVQQGLDENEQQIQQLQLGLMPQSVLRTSTGITSNSTKMNFFGPPPSTTGPPLTFSRYVPKMTWTVKLKVPKQSGQLGGHQMMYNQEHQQQNVYDAFSGTMKGGSNIMGVNNMNQQVAPQSTPEQDFVQFLMENSNVANMIESISYTLPPFSAELVPSTSKNPAAPASASSRNSAASGSPVLSTFPAARASACQNTQQAMLFNRANGWTSDHFSNNFSGLSTAAATTSGSNTSNSCLLTDFLFPMPMGGSCGAGGSLVSNTFNGTAVSSSSSSPVGGRPSSSFSVAMGEVQARPSVAESSVLGLNMSSRRSSYMQM